MLGLLVGVAALVSAGESSQSNATQNQEKIVLSNALFFDCAISNETEPATVHKLAVSYLVYADRPGPQVNFFDTSKLISNQTGWAPKGYFALSRLATDGQLFIWLGRSEAGQMPQINADLELTPAANDPTSASLVLTRFVDDGSGKITVEKFKGQCPALTGKPAYERFQKGAPKQ